MPLETNVVSDNARAGLAGRAAARVGGVVLIANWTSPPTTPRLATACTAMSSAVVADMPAGGAVTLLPQPAIRGSASSASTAHARNARDMECLLTGSIGQKAPWEIATGMP